MNIAPLIKNLNCPNMFWIKYMKPEDWFKREFQKLKKQQKYLEGIEPEIWVHPETDHIIILTMEEDDDPNIYYLTEGYFPNSLSNQKKQVISNKESFSKNLERQGYHYFALFRKK